MIRTLAGLLSHLIVNSTLRCLEEFSAAVGSFHWGFKMYNTSCSCRELGRLLIANSMGPDPALEFLVDTWACPYALYHELWAPFFRTGISFYRWVCYLLNDLWKHGLASWAAYNRFTGDDSCVDLLVVV